MMTSAKTGAQRGPARFPVRVLCLLEHSQTHRLVPMEQVCLIEANSLPTNHKAKHELKQLMIMLMNPQNFMHGQDSANLLIPDRNLLAG